MNNQNNIYTISIDRKTKTWAIFDDDFNCVKPFSPFSEEKKAIEEGLAWSKERSVARPLIVYPKITSVKIK